MPKLSLSVRLSLFWIFTVIVAVAIAVLLNSVYDQGAGSQIELAKRTTINSCSELRRKYLWAIENQSFEPARKVQFQNALLEIILDHYTGVEGGFWNLDDGFTAYAYPTYEGSGIKRDVPEAEKSALAKTSAEALRDLTTTTDLSRGQREAMVITACPIVVENTKVAVWVMTRVSIGAGLAYDRFIWGLVLILGFVVLSGAAATTLLYRWSKNLRALEDAIKNHSIETLPNLPLTQEVELDSIVSAFNALNRRTSEARAEAKILTKKLAQADRLSVLGKMAAGIAHEIRNPLATIRLKFENALVAPVERMPLAVPIIFDQLVRVERLIQMLLSMTQPFELRPQEIKLKKWWPETFHSSIEAARNKQIKLTLVSNVDSWSFDSFHLARALENLLANAIAFTPAHGSVTVEFQKQESSLVITVTDSGSGIDQTMREKMFEPFASARPGGTGLGLLLVREIVEAHGGTIREIPISQGAQFRMEIPWLKF